MKPLERTLHFLFPRHTNNHRPKILHLSGIFLCIAFLLIFQFGLSAVHQLNPQVLGYASNISVADLLKETNDRRAENGVSAVVENSELDQAAAAKASDMFQNQYWAHTSPQGKDPWVFITGAGYSYVFAGENLARDFGDSKGVVDAWMNSPSHKENLLNERFRDVGFAVLNGKYGDSETTLVVQMFGSTSQNQEISAVAVDKTPPKVPEKIIKVETKSVVLPAKTETAKPELDILSLSKSFALGLTILFLGVLIFDTILVYRRKTIRLSGHNFAHILLFLTVAIAVTVLGRGMIR